MIRKPGHLNDRFWGWEAIGAVFCYFWMWCSVVEQLYRPGGPHYLFYWMPEFLSGLCFLVPCIWLAIRATLVENDPLFMRVAGGIVLVMVVFSSATHWILGRLLECIEFAF